MIIPAQAKSAWLARRDHKFTTKASELYNRQFKIRDFIEVVNKLFQASAGLSG